MDYATIQDVIALKRLLTTDEQNRAARLIPIVCTLIRYEAEKTGRNFDDMIERSELVPCVDAFTASENRAEYSLTKEPRGFVKVNVNGEDLDPSGYSVEGKTLTLNAVPPTNALIYVSYSYRGLFEVAKGVVCDVVMRELNTPGNQLPATSYSESAGSVSQSYSLPNSSGSVKLWPSDLKALGLKRQKLDAINMMKPRRGC